MQALEKSLKYGASLQQRHDNVDNDVALESLLTLSWRMPLSYRNQSTDLRSKSMDWFLYDNGLRHEMVNFDDIPHIFLLFLLLSLNKQIVAEK